MRISIGIDIDTDTDTDFLSQCANGPTDNNVSTGNKPISQYSNTSVLQLPALWLPPKSMRRYQWAKGIGGLLFVATFLGWMLLQWSSPIIRWATAAMVALTAWVTLASLISDHRRSRGRQIRLEREALCVTSPRGSTRVVLADVAEARWRPDTSSQAGLWLYDRRGLALLHLDAPFLADESEARRFLAWARQRAVLPFAVRWEGPP